jgi:uncharacterized protein YyaL (SSP411 family)
MRDPSGGFWSSLDADSEGEEGRFYVWSLEEVRDATGPDADVAIARYGFTQEGNFEGKNIPVLAGEVTDPEALERALAALLQRRAQRVRPATDTKVLTGWNALTASALAEAGSALGERAWVQAAEEAMSFLLSTMRVDGRLMRSYRQVEGAASVRVPGCCEDYAFVLEACLALFEATSERAWLEEARWAADEAIRLFADDSDGGFFTTGSDAEELVLRPRDLFDNAVPSANSVMALELQRLAEIVGNSSYQERAIAAIKLVRRAAEQSPTGFGTLLGAVDYSTDRAKEIVVVGPPGNDTDALVDVVRSRFLPNKVLIVSDEPTPEAIEAIPLLEGRSRLDGRATAYVCESGTCKMPVVTREELAGQLDAP